MLITNETDYAIRILRALQDNEKHPVKDICRDEDIPQQFAYKIIRKLSDAGILSSTRGVHGGCVLLADLSDLTLYDVIRITDPERMLATCLKPGEVCPWKEGNGSRCSVHYHLSLIQKTMDEELKKHKMSDMLAYPRQTQGQPESED